MSIIYHVTTRITCFDKKSIVPFKYDYVYYTYWTGSGVCKPELVMVLMF